LYRLCVATEFSGVVCVVSCIASVTTVVASNNGVKLPSRPVASGILAAIINVVRRALRPNRDQVAGSWRFFNPQSNLAASGFSALAAAAD
jgi:hypothetical protein